MGKQKQRPGMIAVLAVFNVIVGAIFMLAAFAAPPGLEAALRFGVGALAVVVGLGLFRLQAWARYVAVGGYVLNIIVSLAETNIIGVIIAAAILAYLLISEDVKAAFAREPLASPVAVGATVEGSR